MGLHSGIVMSSHPMTLYVYASGDAYQDIINVKKLVDFEDANANVNPDADAEGNNIGDGTVTDDGTNNNTNQDATKPGDSTQDTPAEDVVITDGETSLVKIDLQYITKEDASAIVSTFGYDVEILGLDLYEKRVWIKGGADEVDEAVARIKENDTADNDATRTFFTYELQNIVASELQSKIGFVDIDDVEFYFGSYPSRTKSIMVYCNKNQVEEIQELIASLDNNLSEMYYPVATITDASELSVLAAKEELVVKLLNIPTISVASFELSADLDPTDEGVKHVLYVLESPENIDLIVDMWGQIG